MLPAGRPSLGLGSSESAVSTERKMHLNLCIEAYLFRELERQTSQWSCVERGDNKNGVYLGVFGSDQMNCSASHFQFSILIRSHLIFAVLQAPARGSWNLLFVTHLVTPKNFLGDQVCRAA